MKTVRQLRWLRTTCDTRLRNVLMVLIVLKIKELAQLRWSQPIALPAKIIQQAELDDALLQQTSTKQTFIQSQFMSSA